MHCDSFKGVYYGNQEMEVELPQHRGIYELSQSWKHNFIIAPKKASAHSKVCFVFLILCIQDLKVRADVSWKSSGVHKSDILTVCQSPALRVVATASYDGEVVIWRAETQTPMLHLQRRMPAW